MRNAELKIRSQRGGRVRRRSCIYQRPHGDLTTLLLHTLTTNIIYNTHTSCSYLIRSLQHSLPHRQRGSRFLTFSSNTEYYYSIVPLPQKLSQICIPHSSQSPWPPPPSPKAPYPASAKLPTARFKHPPTPASPVVPAQKSFLPLSLPTPHTPTPSPPTHR